MINFEEKKFYHTCYEAYINDYIKETMRQNSKARAAFIIFIITLIIALLGFSKPLFANTNIQLKEDTGQTIYLAKNFEENIKNKYAGSYINFTTKGLAHIKTTKYIKGRPIKINIVELNTNVNPYLKIKPEISSTKLNSKSTVRKIAQKQNALIAVNGGFFKPTTGVPLGALMIDGEVLTGPIYNRVGIGIFEENNNTYFKMGNIDFDIKAYTKSGMYKIDNINQPRMLSTHILIYTNIWGNYSPACKNNNWNVLIRGNKVIAVSANPIKIENNDIVLQGNKEILRKIIKDKEVYINIKLQDEFKKASHIIAAGPYLVKDGQIYIDVKTQKLDAISGKNPRSAIGYKNDGTLIIVTVDGREENSVGMTLTELATMMKKLGCEYAMNFDGGSSSAMYVKGRIVNQAVNKEGIPVSNALIVREEIASDIQISSL